MLIVDLNQVMISSSKIRQLYKLGGGVVEPVSKNARNIKDKDILINTVGWTVIPIMKG